MKRWRGERQDRRARQLRGERRRNTTRIKYGMSDTRRDARGKEMRMCGAMSSVEVKCYSAQSTTWEGTRMRVDGGRNV